MEVKIGFSNILTALEQEGVRTIGTKVLWPYIGDFLELLKERIVAFDWSSCRQEGQAYIDLPGAHLWVSAGVGRRSMNPEDYVVRRYRESVKLYLNRAFAARATSVAAIVYTKNAYLADPDVEKEESKRIEEDGPTHILVAVLSSAGPKNPLTPNRFVHNLAGGNKEALLWTADEIREKAKEIKEYYNEWCVVSD
jgi:hypothetical protein